MFESESYKEQLREESLAIIKSTEWQIDWIGKGIILKKVNQTFDLPNNNLVGTRRKYGPDSVPHRKMIQALKDGTNLVEIEQTIFDLFKSTKEYIDTFNRLINLIGKQYSVIAFLFYLINDRQYLPISKTNF